MVESPSGVPDLYEIILALDDFEDGGGVAAAVPCLDFDPPAFEIRREGAGVAPPVRAPGVVRKEARSESGDRFSRREFGRLGRVRSSRSWRAASSCNLAAGPVPFEALSYRGPDPCADVGLMLCPEPIQGVVQVRSEADAERLHPLTLARPTNSPTVPIVLQISAMVELAGGVWECLISPDVFMLLINFWPGGNCHPPGPPAPEEDRRHGPLDASSRAAPGRAPQGGEPL